ncbi:SAM-dependent methyltransferase [Desulfonema limicola]|uniref:SAM-dependent methyltransferase n=1 Tax=Desulfonema limicola TaxID=45656 RepID=A0A975B5J8_9BACT|nr:class I SAM-dependent methyltransferase [Desulfonema limicola]QTA79206.1 SAM-dependent methyltransferase [Desulfonema limicola]
MKYSSILKLNKTWEIGRRPIPDSDNFNLITDTAVVEQLFRMDYLSQQKIFCNKKVLDVGCGTGYSAEYCIDVGKASHVTGLEVDSLLIENLRKENKKTNLHYVYYSPPDFPLEQHSFDIATCFEVLEHIDEEKQKNILAEISRVLKKDGIAIISTPNRPVYSPDGISANPDHINELDKNQLLRICSKYFSNIQIFGQKRTDENYLIRKQAIHLFSNSQTGKILRKLGVPLIMRKLRKTKQKEPFYIAKKQWIIDSKVDNRTEFLIAICSNFFRDKEISRRKI